MNPKHTIPAVDKALRVLHALAENEEEATAGGLARKLGIAPSTCYRILQTLASHDWLRAAPTGKYVFSAGLFPLLKPLSDYQALFESLGRPLREVVEETGLTAKISVKRGDEAVTVHRVESSRGLSPTSKIGASFPLAYGSSGACLLAGLENAEIERLLKASPKDAWKRQSVEDVWKRIGEVRQKRSCYDPGLYQAPVHGVSSPVFAQDGSTFAAVTLVGWADDFAGEKLPRMRKRIAACADACSQGLALKAAA